LQAEGARQRVGQSGFAHTWHVVDQQVATSQQAGYTILYLHGFAYDHRVKLIQERFEFVLCVHVRTLPEIFEMRVLR
jgi:hypothetical protein